MNNTLKKALILIVAALIGFMAGRVTLSEKTVVKWKEGPKITDTIRIPEPIVINKPAEIKYVPVYTTVRDTVKVLDTLASMQATVEDWNLQRIYAGELFKSDTLGTLNYRATVQYNTLTSLAWDYTPKVKTVTITKNPVFRPFAAVRYNTFEQASVGAGVFVKKIGVEASYLKDFKTQKNGVGVGLIVSF